MVTSREEEEVLESRDKVEKSGPGDSAPINSNASVNETRLAMMPMMKLVRINCGDNCFGKSGFKWQAFSPREIDRHAGQHDQNPMPVVAGASQVRSTIALLHGFHKYGNMGE